MKITYDDKQEIYIVKLEEYENVTMINTKDIVEFNNYKKLGIKGVVSDFIKDNMLVK